MNFYKSSLRHLQLLNSCIKPDDVDSPKVGSLPVYLDDAAAYMETYIDTNDVKFVDQALTELGKLIVKLEAEGNHCCVLDGLRMVYFSCRKELNK